MEAQGLGKLQAAVVIDPENHPETLADFRLRGVQVYGSVEALLQARIADCVSLPVGIHHHAPLTLACLEAGYAVLCEKPMTATVQEADRVIAARDRSARPLVIGYQHLYSDAIQTAKSRLLSGALGQIDSVHLSAGWPRSDGYYSRNNWAGRLNLGDTWVLDSPINNALAHYVNNALYLCGPSAGASCQIDTVEAELYRARDIQSFDTACVRLTTVTGVRITVAMSHATRENFGPDMELRCTAGTVHWNRKGTTLSGPRGDQETVAEDNADLRTLPFKNMAEVLRGRGEVLSTPEIARAQTLCINAAHESCPEITTVPESLVQELNPSPGEASPSSRRCVPGLDEHIRQCVSEGRLFSEIGVGWAQPSRPFDASGYSAFPTPGKHIR